MARKKTTENKEILENLTDVTDIGLPEVDGLQEIQVTEVEATINENKELLEEKEKETEWKKEESEELRTPNENLKKSKKNLKTDDQDQEKSQLEIPANEDVVTAMKKQEEELLNSLNQKSTKSGKGYVGKSTKPKTLKRGKSLAAPKKRNENMDGLERSTFGIFHR